MKNLFKNKNLIRKLVIVGILVYVVITLINQQRTLNSYKNAQTYNAKRLQDEQEHNESLLAMQESINSQEYIEQVARETLDMYLPNEKVYMDRSK